MIDTTNSIDAASILRIIVYGFWMPFIGCFGAYILFKWFSQRHDRRVKDEIEYRRLMVKEKSAQESKYETEREIERIRDMIPKLIESSLEKNQYDLLYRMQANMQEVFKQGINELSQDLRYNLYASASDQRDSKDIQKEDRSGQLVREISHSLNTPLALIESSLLSLKAENKNNGTGNSDILKTLDTIQTSINICKSVLAAYRQLVLVTKSTTLWSPDSISDAIKSAALVYSSNSNKSLEIAVDMPLQVSGYSNNYIVSLLLPIVENAIDSGLQESKVSIKGFVEGSYFVTEISNATDEPPKTDVIYTDGYTTKQKHEGTGLSIVKYLLSAQRGASISHSYNGKLVTFRVVLPVGE